MKGRCTAGQLLLRKRKSDQRGPTALPRAGTRADETKRSKRSDPPAMGALDFDAADRSGRADRKGLTAILLRTGGRRIAAIGFPVPRAGQMADHSRLALGRRAIVRPLDISDAAHRADASTTAGTSQIQRQDLRAILSPMPPVRAPKTSPHGRSRIPAPSSPHRAPAP
jgi:hypothetical protein